MGWPNYEAEGISNFWKDVAGTGRYHQESQTWQWPEELKRVVQVVRSERPDVIVCYGCADGCRDPYQLAEAALEQGFSIDRIVAIDCSEGFEEDIRSRLEQLGMASTVEFLVNDLSQAKRWYSADQDDLSINAEPEKGLLSAELGVFEDKRIYDYSGLPLYLLKMKEVDDFFADSFWFAPFVLENRKSATILTPLTSLAIKVSQQEAQNALFEATLRAKSELRSSVAKARHNRNYAGIVAVSVGENAAFQSTWYNRRGFRQMLRAAGIGKQDGFELDLSRVGKGLVAEVKPTEGANGLLTALGNAIGCAHLSHQLGELRKIVKMLKGRPPHEVIGSSSEAVYAK